MEMKPIVRLLVTVCCFMLLVGTASKSLAASRITSDIKITPQTTLTPDERKALSVAAARMFHHIDKARRQIERKDSKTALRNVEQALTLANIIDNAVPELQVNATIKSGELTYQNAEKVKQVIVPIYRQEDEFLDASSPGSKAARRTVAKGSAGPVFRAGFEEREMLLDIGEARFFLNEAMSALKKNDLKSSDRSLARVDDAVVFVTEKLDLPLERARMNLLEASRMAAANQFKGAEEFLHRAVAALQEYQSEVGGGIAQKARTLTDSIKELSGKLEQDKAGAQQKLSDFVRELGKLL